jgi:hypothetical protein
MSAPSAGTLADMAWQALAGGDPAGAQSFARAAVAAAHGRSRKERQQAQIVQLAVTGHRTRASGLIAEHLAEFPGDELIQRIKARISTALAAAIGPDPKIARRLCLPRGHLPDYELLFTRTRE